MAALTADRNTRMKAQGTQRQRADRGVAASTVVYKGGIAAINASGWLVPASDIAGLIVVGIFEETVDNSAGSAGEVNASYMTGVEVELDNPAAVCVQGTLQAYATSDHEVAPTGSTTHHVRVGVLTEFSTNADMVWVFIDETSNITAST
jgi:hypothetical protein